MLFLISIKDLTCGTVFSKIIDEYEAELRKPEYAFIAENNFNFDSIAAYCISFHHSAQLLTELNFSISYKSEALDLKRSYNCLYHFTHTNIWMTYEIRKGRGTLILMQPKEDYKCTIPVMI